MKKFLKIALFLGLSYVLYVIGTLTYTYYNEMNGIENKLDGTTWVRASDSVSFYFKDSDLIVKREDEKMTGDVYFGDSYSDIEDDEPMSIGKIISDFKSTFPELKSTKIQGEDLKYINYINYFPDGEGMQNWAVYEGGNDTLFVLNNYTQEDQGGMIWLKSANSGIKGSYKASDIYNSESTDEEDEIENLGVFDVVNDKITFHNESLFLVNFDEWIKYQDDANKFKNRKQISQLLRNRGYGIENSDSIYILNQGLFIVPVENGKKLFLGFMKNNDSSESDVLVLLEQIELKD